MVAGHKNVKIKKQVGAGNCRTRNLKILAWTTTMIRIPECEEEKARNRVRLYGRA